MQDILARIKMFFNPEYLFLAYPNPDTSFMPYLLIFFGILLLLGIVSLVFIKKKKKSSVRFLWGQISNWSWWSSIVGLILLALRYEGIYYLSSRFLLLLWIVVTICWGLWILIFYRKKYKKIVLEIEAQKNREKYMPRRK